MGVGELLIALSMWKCFLAFTQMPFQVVSEAIMAPSPEDDPSFLLGPLSHPFSSLSHPGL